MKNWLVIHNDNITRSTLNRIKDEGQEILKFDVTPAQQLNENFSFDNEATNILSNHFVNDKNYDCIFIPFNLNKDLYLDFSGLKVAIHIRLSPQFKHTHCPIVFYGFENPIHVAKISSYSKILFSIGSLTTNKISFENFDSTCDYLKEMSNDDYYNFLHELNIIPEVDYSSHHSIANELALFQWSTYIGCDEQIDQVKLNRTRLYFKYLEAIRLFKIDKGWESEIDNKESEPPQLFIDGKLKIEQYNEEGMETSRLARVLLIDDESNKGWGSFYDSLFKLNPIEDSRVKFEFLNIEDKEGREIKFSTLKREQIIAASINKVKDFDPDVVLLDLRLQDDDFKKNISPFDLTGIQIAKEIYRINQGIQIIITSASNKIWNYAASESTGLGVNGFIIKSNDQSSLNTLMNIRQIISQSLLKAQFLKPVYEKIKNIKDLFPEQTSSDFKKNLTFYFNSSMNLDVAFKLLNDSFINIKFISAGFSQLFYIVEDFIRRKDVFISEKLKDHVFNNYVICNNNRVLVRHADTSSITTYNISEKLRNTYKIKDSINCPYDLNFKISAVLIYRFGQETSNSKLLPWIELRNTRNEIAHGSGNTNSKQEQIIKLLDFILFILNDKNQYELNISKGCKIKSEEEKINELVNKFKK